MSSPHESIQYEVEMKCLLDGKPHAEELKEKLSKLNGPLTLTQKSSQLNHYFIEGNLEHLIQSLKPHLPLIKKKELRSIQDVKGYSVRTRQENNVVMVVVKASIDDTTSFNGISRIEFTAHTPTLTLDQLDQLIIDAGFSYQAKWSREREEYAFQDLSVCIDKNAGYGYLAEFEKIVHTKEKVKEARNTLRRLIAKLEIEELPQDRLERMFAHYNKHWKKYYGTDKTFTVL